MSRQFSPRLSTPQNQITAKGPVQDSGAFASAVGLVEDVGEEVLKNRALEELDKELTAIENARLAGGNRHKLSLQAKTKLNQAKANAPGLTAEFDKAFSAKFGGGSGGSGGGAGGIFSATPTEKGQEKATAATAELATMMNISIEDADELIAKKTRLTELSKIEEADAVLRRGKKERNADEVRLSSNAYIENELLDLDKSYGTIISTQGSIDANNKLMFTNAITQKKREAIADLDRKVKGQEGMLISGAEYDAQVARINKRFDDYLKMISDNTLEAKAKLITSENNAIAASLVAETMPLLNAVPQSVAPQIMEIYMNAESSYGEAIQAANPWMTGLINSVESYKRNLTTGMNSLPIAGGKFSQPEAGAIGSTLASRNMASTALVLLDSLADNPDASKNLKEVSKKNPDAIMPYITNPALVSKANNNPAKFKEQFVGLAEGTATAFKSMGIQSGAIPRNVVVTEKKLPVGSSPDMTPIVTIKGDGVTQDMALIGRNLYSAVKKNPELMMEVGKDLGLSEENITPETVTALYLNPNPAEGGGQQVQMQDPRTGQDGDANSPFNTMQKAMAKVQEQRPDLDEKGLLESLDEWLMQFTPAIQASKRSSEEASEEPKAKSEPSVRTEGDKPSELDTEHLSRIEELRQQGFTKEQILAVQESLGFADNATNKRVKSLVEKVFASAGA